jgi:hypothetical protein
MLRSLTLGPVVLGIIIIAALVICKYFNTPELFLVILVLASIFYQRDTNQKNHKTHNFEETLINVSKFIIVTGILGYVVAKVVGLFLPGFD